MTWKILQGVRSVGRELIGGLSAVLMAMALIALILPPSVVYAAPCCAGRGQAVNQDAPRVSDEDLQAFRAAWDRLATGAQWFLDESDRSRFELGALQARLGTDPGVIFAWVREHTRWVPYQGALKGPRGVLLSRQGSTLDRSLFLARLLELAGHSVRIANGEASPRRFPELEHAARASMSAAWPGARSGQPADPKRLADLAEALGMTIEELEAETARVDGKRAALADQITATTDRHVAALRGLLDQESLPVVPKAAQSVDVVQASLKQHYWVQLMTGDSEWKDYDLFFESGQLPGLVVIRGAPFETAKVPAGLLHEVSLKVVVVAEHGNGRRTESVALEHAVATAHAGVGEFSLAFVDLRAPSPAEMVEQFEGKDNTVLLGALERRSEWVPVIAFPSAAEPVAQSGFDAKGALIPDPLAVGQTVGSRVKAGTSLLESLGRDAGPVEGDATLAEVRVEVSTKDAAGAISSEQRVVYRRGTGNDQEEARRRAVALGRTTQFLVQTGRLPGEYAHEVQCERILGINLAMRYLLDPDDGADPESAQQRVVKVLEKTYEFSPVLYALAAERQLAAGHDRQFQARPNVLSLVREWQLEGESLRWREVVDLIDNTVEMIPGDAREEAFWSNLRSGVGDSVLESELHLARRAGTSASRAFEEDPASWELVKSVDDPRLLSWEAPSEEAREAVRSDLEGGYWVLIDLDGPAKEGAWWRVHPGSGCALGMTTESGSVGGAAMPEWLIITLRVVIIAGMHFFNIYKCLFDGPSSGAKSAVCVGCVFVASFVALASLGGAFATNGAGLGVDAIGVLCTGLSEVL